MLSLLEKHPEGLKRGRKLLDLDVRLVILLEWLRHGETYKELALSFNITNSQTQTSITSLWNSLSQALFEDIIPKNPLGYESKRTFDNYFGAIGALDASLIPIVKLNNSPDKKLYYSGKHHRHRMKGQALGPQMARPNLNLKSILAHTAFGAKAPRLFLKLISFQKLNIKANFRIFIKKINFQYFIFHFYYF